MRDNEAFNNFDPVGGCASSPSLGDQRKKGNDQQKYSKMGYAQLVAGYKVELCIPVEFICALGVFIMASFVLRDSWPSTKPCHVKTMQTILFRVMML